uniref:Transposase n=1 Tax=Globodera pallida TaxID=36090 RepID=A0A183CPZ0_GLOPA
MHMLSVRPKLGQFEPDVQGLEERFGNLFVK